MRKRFGYRQLGRTSSHRMAMLKNMVTSLIEHDRIQTTFAKGKEVQRFADKIVTIAKKATLRATMALQSPPQASQPEEVNAIESGPGSDTSTTISKEQYLNANAALLHGRRQLSKLLQTDVAVQKVMNVLRHRYALRDGGYTRLLKLVQPRAGDNADMCVIEYIDWNNEIRAARPPQQQKQKQQQLSSIQLQQQLETLRNLYDATNTKKNDAMATSTVSTK